MDFHDMRYQVYAVLIIAVAALLLQPGCAAAAAAYRSSTSTARNCQFSAIFNFGDSNSDTGGLSAAFGQAPPPNGQTFFHHPAGRFSDGRLVIDFIAESLGLPYLSAYLDAIGSNFSHGANFATAGSTIRPQNTTMSQSGYSPISLDVQFTQFSDFQTRSQVVRNQGGVFELLLPDEKAFSSALYTFDIGQNDLTAGYKLNLSTEQVKAYVPDLLLQLSKVIKNVYAKGGRSFWIHNTGPVGCLPYIMDRLPVTAAQIDEHGCAKPYNDVAQFFNFKLKETVAELRTVLPLASITYVDMYSVKYSLISNAKKLGFENPFLVCCGHGGKFNFNGLRRCGAKKYVNGTEIVIAMSCKKPQSRISWDGIHFTEAGNKWIFDQIVDGSFSDPQKNPVEKDNDEHETDSLASNSKVVTSFCTPAPYKDACERSIDVVAKNLTATDKDYIMAVIDSTVNEIKNAMAVVNGIKIDQKQDPYHHMAVADCKELLDEAIDELQACVSLLDKTELHSLEVHHIHELLNWLSTVHSYESSCLDDIENPVYRTILENGMANASQLTHNAVNMFADIPLVLKGLDQELGNNIHLRSRRLLIDLGKDGYPTWLPVADRKLLSEPVQQEGVLRPNATVAKDGSGQFKTISEAVAAYPQNSTGRYFIYVKEGVYQEGIVIDKKKPNIFIYGDGAGKTIITGDKNNGIMKIPTKDTATLIAIGQGFIARGMTIRNTAGPDGHQAVALRIQSDMAAFFNCSIEGYQDTLYYHAHRQFFRNCVISGTVDFIFGRGSALIQNSDIIVRKGNPNQFNAVTADGKELEKDRTGLVLQNCRIVADPELYLTRFETRTYLGRPWKKYAKTVIMESEIGDFIRPEGYTKFETQNMEVNEPTCQYFEFDNRGPGAKTDNRDFKQFSSSRVIDEVEAAEYTANSFLDGNVWLPQTGTPHVLGFTRS